MKKILIIGATSAIANACARLWATDGSEFFLVARNNEKLQQISADLYARGAKSVAVYNMDVTDLQAHSSMLNHCLEKLQQIDISLMAHGTLPDQKICEKDIPIAIEEFNNNGISTIALLSLLANHFEKQHCGTIAVISSVAGDRGRSSNYLYGSAKAAVSAFCEGLRARLFKVGVHLIDIKPGFVDTPMTQGLALPKALVVTPEQVALRITKGIERKIDILYAPGFWWGIMLIIKLIPNVVFKRISL